MPVGTLSGDVNPGSLGHPGGEPALPAPPPPSPGLLPDPQCWNKECTLFTLPFPCSFFNDKVTPACKRLGFLPACAQDATAGRCPPPPTGLHFEGESWEPDVVRGCWHEQAVLQGCGRAPRGMFSRMQRESCAQAALPANAKGGLSAPSKRASSSQQLHVAAPRPGPARLQCRVLARLCGSIGAAWLQLLLPVVLGGLRRAQPPPESPAAPRRLPAAAQWGLW